MDDSIEIPELVPPDMVIPDLQFFPFKLQTVSSNGKQIVHRSSRHRRMNNPHNSNERRGGQETTDGVGETTGTWKMENTIEALKITFVCLCIALVLYILVVLLYLGYANSHKNMRNECHLLPNNTPFLYGFSCIVLRSKNFVLLMSFRLNMTTVVVRIKKLTIITERLLSAICRLNSIGVLYFVTLCIPIRR